MFLRPGPWLPPLPTVGWRQVAGRGAYIRGGNLTGSQSLDPLSANWGLPWEASPFRPRMTCSQDLRASRREGQAICSAVRRDGRCSGPGTDRLPSSAPPSHSCCRLPGGCISGDRYRSLPSHSVSRSHLPPRVCRPQLSPIGSRPSFSCPAPSCEAGRLPRPSLGCRDLTPWPCPLLREDACDSLPIQWKKPISHMCTALQHTAFGPPPERWPLAAFPAIRALGRACRGAAGGTVALPWGGTPGQWDHR